jgi:hypothetical protein
MRRRGRLLVQAGTRGARAAGALLLPQPLPPPLPLLPPPPPLLICQPGTHQAAVHAIGLDLRGEGPPSSAAAAACASRRPGARLQECPGQAQAAAGAGAPHEAPRCSCDACAARRTQPPVGPLRLPGAQRAGLPAGVRARSGGSSGSGSGAP